MSEKTEAFVANARRMIREIKDPVELQRQLEEMVGEEFPVARPTFRVGDTMPMHEFLARYQKNICYGVVPRFYESSVHIVEVLPSLISIEIEPSPVPATTGDAESVASEDAPPSPGAPAPTLSANLSREAQ
jgi:hypothetical protein